MELLYRRIGDFISYIGYIGDIGDSNTPGLHTKMDITESFFKLGPPNFAE